MTKPMRIGIDFDNTIAGYDRVFAALAAERDLFASAASARGKKAVRDGLRARPGGEIAWQRLQALAYGPRMAGAEINPGFADFVAACRGAGIPLCIVSHKTRHSPIDPQGPNLRSAALAWMESKGFFVADGLGFKRGDVHFADTRGEKIAKIAGLGCTHFIDDLEEVFAEGAFPAGVTGILFGGTVDAAADATLVRCPRWDDVTAHLLPRRRTALPRPAALKSIAETLSGRPVGAVTQVLGGGNNRLFRVADADGATYALKTYRGTDKDGAARRQAEFGGLAFLWSHGVRVIPRPIAQDAKQDGALYSWIEGAPVSEPGAADIEAALDFAARLLELSRLPEARHLPPAREACLSAAELVRQIKRRRARLENEAVYNTDLQNFLMGAFDLAVVEGVEAARRSYPVGGMEFATEIGPARRTLSPSDFGFHNALRGPDGTVVFLDFEYFGWDDPVKLVADFLLHPGMTLGAEERSQFRDGARRVFAAEAGFAERLAVLFPLYALRWSLIALNEFLPDAWARRRYARGPQSHEAVLKAQLTKAAALVRRAREVPAHAA